MNKIFCYYLLIIFIPSILLAQWQPTNGPEGSSVNDIIKKDNYVFSCTGEFAGGGVYRSSDEGETWEFVSDRFEPTNRVNSLSSNEDFIFAGIRSSGIYRSSDYGETWEVKNNGLMGDEKSTTALLAHQDTVIAGSQFLGIFRSNDNGGNWFNFSTGLSGLAKRINDIILHQDKYFIATDDGVYRYSENLTSWEAANSGLPPHCYTILSYDTFLITGTLNGVYRSTNEGSSWSFVGNGLPSGTIHALASDSGTIYSGIDGIIYKSNDAGDNWIAVPNGLPGDFNRVYSLYADTGLLLAGFRTLGIYKSTNGGNEWFLSSKGIANVSVYDLESQGNRLFAVSEDADYGLIFRTDNNGEKWNISNKSATIIGYMAFHNNGNSLWAGSFGDGLYRSMDDGDNWEKISTSIFSPSYVSALAGNDSVLFVGTEGFSIDVYKTTDNGTSFESLNVPGSGNITALQSKNGFVFAGRTTGVYRTSDNGENWVSINSGFPSNVFVQDINSNNNFIFVSTINSGLFRSSNNGDDWEEIGSGIINDVAYSIETKNEQIFIGTRASGLFYSDDNGLTWTEFNEKLFSGFSGTYPRVLSMIVKSDTVYCGLQNYGVWKSPVPTITNVAIDEFLPTEFSLSQNYPNPFNPSTTIQYNLSRKSEVVLKIFDMLGREIKTLVDRVQSSGQKSVSWDGTDQSGNLVSSGIYLYRLRSGEFTDSKKMILMK